MTQRIQGAPRISTVAERAEYRAKNTGIWINTGRVSVGAAPSFYVVASTRPLHLILTPEQDQRYRISVPLAMRSFAGPVEVEDTVPYTEALIRLREGEGLYRLDDGAVRLAEQTLFRADVRLPANLIEGDYSARIFLLRDGKVIDTFRAPIEVRKVGLERWLYRVARKHAGHQGDGWLFDLRHLHARQPAFGLGQGHTLAAGVVGQALDHAMRTGCDHGGIEGMVAVAGFAHFGQAPAGAQEGGGLAAEHDATLAVAAFGQLQVTLDVVLEEATHCIAEGGAVQGAGEVVSVDRTIEGLAGAGNGQLAGRSVLRRSIRLLGLLRSAVGLLRCSVLRRHGCCGRHGCCRRHGRRGRHRTSGPERKEDLSTRR